jgi:hypothetical protein
MQAMARHSDPKLTLGRYTHTEIGEQGDALGLLPDLSDAFKQSQLATGTDGAALSWRFAWRKTAPRSAFQRLPMPRKMRAARIASRAKSTEERRANPLIRRAES